MSQPLDFPSAGSVFRNPVNNFAGKLIEDIGYKGKNEGGEIIYDCQRVTGSKDGC